MPVETGNLGRLVSLAGIVDEHARGRVVETRSVQMDGSSISVLQSNPKRIMAILQHAGNVADDIWVSFGVAAAGNTGFLLSGKGALIQIDQDLPWSGDVRAISGGTPYVLVTEISLQ